MIESLSVKYSLWNSNGVPLRAVCTVKLTEAVKMSAGGGESTNYRSRGDNEEDNKNYQRELARREAARREETERQVAKQRSAGAAARTVGKS